MRIVHVCENFSESGGGLPKVVADHIRWQKVIGWNVSLFTAISSNTFLDKVECDRAVTSAPNGIGAAWRWSPRQSISFNNLVGNNIHIIHLHGIWTGPQAVAALFCKKNNFPLVISFHGQLLDEALGSMFSLSRIKKVVYLKIIKTFFIDKRFILHAITEKEANDLRERFPNNSVCLIPNYVDVAACMSLIGAMDSFKILDKKEILYLGRLDVRKGVLLLLEAFVKAALPENWILRIVGPDDTPGLRAKLSKMAREYQCEHRIFISDAVYGIEKWKLLKGASLFCLPSYHEVMGLANLEAAVSGTPVLTTPKCGLVGFEEAGGFLAEPSIDSMAIKLREISSMSDEDLKRRGYSLNKWVVHNFDVEVIKLSWQKLYGSFVKLCKR